jgi:hypothetical protein
MQCWSNLKVLGQGLARVAGRCDSLEPTRQLGPSQRQLKIRFSFSLHLNPRETLKLMTLQVEYLTHLDVVAHADIL